MNVGGTWLKLAGARLKRLRGLCDGLCRLQALSSVKVLIDSSKAESIELRRSLELISLSISGCVAWAHSATVSSSSRHTSADMRSPALTASRTNAATPTEARLWCGRLYETLSYERSGAKSTSTALRSLNDCKQRLSAIEHIEVCYRIASDVGELFESKFGPDRTRSSVSLATISLVYERFCTSHHII